jgi:cytochrome c2
MPLFAWVPSIAPTNVIEVKSFDRRWNGDLLVGSLKAMSLFRFRRTEGRVLYAEPIWIGQRIRDLAQLRDGTIVLWTDDSDLLFLSVDGKELSRNERPAIRVSQDLNNACMYCHHFGPTSPSDFAPSLTDLFGREIASDNFRYSAGLRAKQGTWTEEALREFLRDPSGFAEGTVMPNLGLSLEQLTGSSTLSRTLNSPKQAPVTGRRNQTMLCPAEG